MSWLDGLITCRNLAKRLSRHTARWITLTAIVLVSTPALAVAPVVTIDSGGGTYAIGDTVTLTGTATDAEDGTITDDIDWTSNLETGSIGTGSPVGTAALSAGTHTITASITDSELITVTATTSVTITDINSESKALQGRQQFSIYYDIKQ